MNIPNLQLAADRRLDPTLEELVHKLSLAKPNWFFRKPTGAQIYKSSIAKKDSQKVDAPEGIHFIREIEVVQDDRPAGTIEIGGSWNRPLEFELRSHRLNNGRKGNRMNTTNMGKALSIAKKTFSPKNTGEIMYGRLEDAAHNFKRSIERLALERRHHRASTGACAYLMQDYVRAVLRDERPDPTVEGHLRELLLSESFEACMANSLLAHTMHGRTYKCVAIIDGDYCMFTADSAPATREDAINAEVSCGPFETLPSDMQDKLAVLQLMSDNELVLDVGYKVSSDVYLVVEKVEEK